MAQPSSSIPDTRPLDATPVQAETDREESRRLSLRHAAVPATVGGYEILRCIGEGSFGTVWLAREKRTGRQVAVKFFTNRRGLDWSLLTREVEKLAVLDASRDVVRLLDVGMDHDPPYFVMEYLPQRSVAHLLQAGALSVPQALEITRSVTRALVHAHSAGILHCDIKPGNVLLDLGDEARLGDFGQSRLVTEQSAALGTFYYMAPEQAKKDAAPDVRWDLYAVGALLFHMLTGAPPYQSEENEALLRAAPNLEARLAAYRQLIEDSPFPTEHRSSGKVDAPLADLIDRCLERDPVHRLPSAQTILDRIEKRELQHARRPLVALGFLGPVVFMLALLWIASRVIPGIVREAESHLADRALASDAATVRLLAASIEQELAERLAELEQLAEDLPARDNQPDWYGLRSDFRTVIERWKVQQDARYSVQQRTLDESLFLCDGEGNQLFRDPWSGSVGKSYRYRDYFHGLGRELSPDEAAGDVQPRNISGISTPFLSTNTGQFMVAVAAPVWSDDHSKIIGVLARTLHLSELLDQWKRRIQERDRLLTLVDMRESPPLILNHDWLTPEKSLELGPDANVKEILRLKPEEQQRLEQAVGDAKGLRNYEDPLADVDGRYAQPWLAAVAKVNSVNWITIVQERQRDAVAPMTNLYGMFLRYGLLTLVVFGSLLLVLWWLIQRAADS